MRSSRVTDSACAASCALAWRNQRWPETYISYCAIALRSACRSSAADRDRATHRFDRGPPFDVDAFDLDFELDGAGLTLGFRLKQVRRKTYSISTAGRPYTMPRTSPWTNSGSMPDPGTSALSTRVMMRCRSDSTRCTCLTTFRFVSFT